MEKADEQEQIKAKELGFREAYIDERGVICYRKPSSRVNEKEYKKVLVGLEHSGSNRYYPIEETP